MVKICCWYVLLCVCCEVLFFHRGWGQLTDKQFPSCFKVLLQLKQWYFRFLDLALQPVIVIIITFHTRRCVRPSCCQSNPPCSGPLLWSYSSLSTLCCPILSQQSLETPSHLQPPSHPPTLRLPTQCCYAVVPTFSPMYQFTNQKVSLLPFLYESPPKPLTISTLLGIYIGLW